MARFPSTKDAKQKLSRNIESHHDIRIRDEKIAKRIIKTWENLGEGIGYTMPNEHQKIVMREKKGKSGLQRGSA